MAADALLRSTAICSRIVDATADLTLSERFPETAAAYDGGDCIDAIEHRRGINLNCT